MEIREIRWKNYKGFQDSGWISLSPITVFIGTNGSGKSSLLSPLLLLHQTLSSPDSETPIITKGPYINAGGYKSLVNNHDLSKDVYFGYRFRGHAKKSGDESFPSSIELTFDHDKEFNGFSLKQYQIRDKFHKRYLTRNRLKSGSYSLISHSIKYSKMDPLEKKLLKKSRPTNFMFSPAAEMNSIARNRGTYSSQITNEFQRYLMTISIIFTEVRRQLGSLSYLGPLRDTPKRIYEALGEKPINVGPQGSVAPNLLRRQSFNSKRLINKWVKKFDLGEKVNIKPVHDDLFEMIFVDNDGSESNISEKGFGASQVFPLIIELLAEGRDSMLLAEQPEIHLNPRLQCVLADLLVEAIKNRKNPIIVETHSEHLILRLRRLIAEGVVSESDVGLYFVEQVDGCSRVRRIPIDESGAIKDKAWPSGFFQETLQESFALASAQIKRKKQ